MFVYVSGKYTAKTREERQANIAAARQVAGELWKLGHTALCPHLNTANFEDDFPEITYQQFIESDLVMLARCDAMVMVADWEESKGACIEERYARQLGIPVYYPHQPLPERHPTEVKCPVQAKRFAEILGQLYRTHLSKNADYSPANVTGPGELGLGTRLWDKATRAANLSGIDVDVEKANFYFPAAALEAIIVKLKKLGFRIKARLWPGAARTARNEPFDDSLLDAACYHVIWKLYREGAWGR